MEDASKFKSSFHSVKSAREFLFQRGGREPPPQVLRGGCGKVAGNPPAPPRNPGLVETGQGPGPWCGGEQREVRVWPGAHPESCGREMAGSQSPVRWGGGGEHVRGPGGRSLGAPTGSAGDSGEPVQVPRESGRERRGALQCAAEL